MSPLTPQQCILRLRALYRDAFKRDGATDAEVLSWGKSPESWATWQIRQFGWSYQATEAVVRQCRILYPRAARATEQ